MNSDCSPSLEHMVAVKIALRLCDCKDIEKLLEEEWIETKCGRCFDRKDELWELIKKTAAEKLPSLPDTLKDKVSKFVRPLHGETKRWSCDHNCLLGLSANGCYLLYKSILCWKADGTVNRVQTAIKLVHDRNIHPETRFAVACTYFLEEEVLALWHGNEEVRLTRDGKNAAVRFWIERLKEGSWKETPLNVMAERYFKTSRFRLSDIRLRVSSFFPYLSWEDKKTYFVSLFRNRGHTDDHRSCWQAMTEAERMELFSTDPARCLHDYLKWPLQSLFKDMVNRLRSRMDTHHFKSLLKNIVIFFICLGLDDFDYLQLLKDFWHDSPASFKTAMKEEGKFFELVELTLKCDKQNPSPSLPEPMNKYVRAFFGCKCA